MNGPAPVLRQAAALLLALVATVRATAQQDPLPELDAGPVICMSRAESKPHRVHLYAANCDGAHGARRFWTNRGNVKLLARLDRTHFLVGSYGEPYALLVVDAATGAHRVLAEGAPHGFVAVHGGDVLYIGDNRWGKGDHHLYAQAWREQTPRRRLADVLLDEVAQVRGNLAIGIAAGEREIWKVSLTRGQGRRVAELPEGAMQPRVAVSPSGQRLAIGCNVQGRGHLTVVDLATARPLRSWKDLNIGVSPVSSFLGTLEVGWHDDAHVLTTETVGGRFSGHFAFLRRSLATGEVVEQRHCGPMGLYHPAPPADRAAPAGPPAAFELRTDGERQSLVRRGDGEVITDVAVERGRASDLLLSPDGRYAVERPDGDQHRMILHRPGRAPLPLIDAWATDLTWFEAVR
ncbi:MAG: hypothetical protein KAI24_09710 [Planctomycetes bacterium]|nr:hypothetical protein [Planctomycetota bacterium]